MGPDARRAGGTALTLFLCGDVMLGRGIDQVLPHPGDPTLQERHVGDARDYVALATARNGQIPIPVDWSWPWGDALEVLEAAGCDARVVNLETSVTTQGAFEPGKGVHYRMNPANLKALAVARPDVCVLANNHVLDFGRQGLAETLDALAGVGLATAGAGLSLSSAQVAAVVPAASAARTGRVLVLAFGCPSSGIPLGWAATPDRSGVHLVQTLTDRHADQLCELTSALRRPGDVVIASVHWGSNWGYRVERDQLHFAHRLVDGGVDVVHGHSSHHPRPLEVYRGKLILYGCGDFIDDYEGITGYERYRDDLRLLYLARVDSASGDLLHLRMVPLQARQLRLRHASRSDAEWLQEVLTATSSDFGSRIDIDEFGSLTLRFS